MNLAMENKTLPNNWKTVKLGEVGEISSGGTPDTTNSNYWNGDIFWITPTEITKLENRFIYKTERKITKEGLKNSSAKLLPINSVIVCTRATIGEIGINKIELATNQGFKNIIVNKDNNVDYIYFLLKQNKHKLIEKASGSTFLEISKSEFENLEFYLPPLPEQTRIAACLSVWDEAIEKLKKLIEAKKKLKKGLMQRLLSPENPLAGFEGVEWRSVRLGEVICETKKTNRLSSSGQNEGKYPFFTNSTKSFNTYINEYDFAGEFIIANTGGKAYFDYYNGQFGAMSDCYVFNVKNNSIKYIFYILKEKEEFIDLFGFSGSGIKHLDKKWFKNLEIHLPPLPTQQRIAEILSKADEEIELLQKKLNNFETQKKGLMQILLSGRVRFSEFIS
jgi:type I restriction enzyme S subunit